MCPNRISPSWKEYPLLMLPQREQVNRVLSDNGIPSLDEDPSVLMAMIAKQIHTHRDLRNFLFTRVDVQMRGIALETLRPWLSFTPCPMDTYEAQVKEEAERKQMPTLSEDGLKVIPFSTAAVNSQDEKATEVVATECVKLTCSKCTREGTFFADTYVGAMIKAREAGWVRDLVLGRESCPKCPAVRERAVKSSQDGAADIDGEIGT